MDLEKRKATTRRLALARRARLTDDQRAAAGQAIVERLAALPEMAGTGPVCAFVGVRSEVPTRPLLAAILEAGRPLLLPFVADDGTMRAAQVSSIADLDPGAFGIPEPRTRFPVDPSTASVIVTPGVAFDAHGRRLGYGGGFYDTFLATAPHVARVGLCFDVQIVEEVPVGRHDQPVQVVVTEERTLRAG